MTGLYTTFRLLQQHGACTERYTYLADALDGEQVYGRETPIPLSLILKMSGPIDAIWALQAVPPEQAALRDRIARLHAIQCAVGTPLYDGRPLSALLRNGQAVRALMAAWEFVWGEATARKVQRFYNEAVLGLWAGIPTTAKVAARAAACTAAGDARQAAVEAGAYARWAAAQYASDLCNNPRAYRPARLAAAKWQVRQLRELLKWQEI